MINCMARNLKALWRGCQEDTRGLKMLEELSERTNRSSCDVTIFSTPLTRITAPPNDDDARFRRTAETTGLRRTKMEGATITLIHQFNVTRANNKSSGMVMTPSRTQSITPYMNRRIVRSTPRIQNGDLAKKKMPHARSIYRESY